MKGVPVCQYHGGRAFQAQRKVQEAKHGKRRKLNPVTPG
jgi:hypothetical protein